MLRDFGKYVSTRLLEWRMCGHTLLIIAGNGTLLMQGKIQGFAWFGDELEIHLDDIDDPKDSFVYLFHKGIKWNPLAIAFEVHHDMDDDGGFHATATVGIQHDGRRNREEDGEEPEHGESETHRIGSIAPAHGASFGEIEDRLGPGYSGAVPRSVSEARTERTGKSADADPKGPSRPISVEIGINNRVPENMAVAVYPDQTISIFALNEPRPPAPSGTRMWINSADQESLTAYLTEDAGPRH